MNFSARVENISHSFASPTRDKIRIHAQPCNILYKPFLFLSLITKLIRKDDTRNFKSIPHDLKALCLNVPAARHGFNWKLRLNIFFTFFKTFISIRSVSETSRFLFDEVSLDEIYLGYNKKACDNLNPARSCLGALRLRLRARKGEDTS